MSRLGAKFRRRALYSAMYAIEYSDDHTTEVS